MLKLFERLLIARAPVKYLDDGQSDTDIVELNISTSISQVCEIDENLKMIRQYYLGDADRVKMGMPGRSEPGIAERLAIGIYNACT